MHVLADPTVAASVGASVLLAWVFDGMCLFLALDALGVHVTFDVLLLAYTVGAAASFIPFLPAGLGVVETVTPALLHLYGVPWEGALAGLLVYRALGTVLPALVGVGSLATLRVQAPPEEDDAEAADHHPAAVANEAFTASVGSGRARFPGTRDDS